VNDSAQDWRRIELATSKSPIPHRIDAEDESMRETWSSLSELLAAIPSGFDEAGLLLGIRATLARRRRRRAMALAAAIIAAAALAVVNWRTQSAAAPQLVQTDAPTDISLVTHSPESFDLQELPWHDELDDEISAVREQVAYLGRSWRAGPDPLAAIRSRLDRLEIECAESAL
jgi:hypothetical protein